ncbi:MAG: DUF4124 domain-containing protein, partial [Xanthomonadales bacterium]|nr:DUF4124 domain-containing protein [Xanthomonadales bacterium]
MTKGMIRTVLCLLLLLMASAPAPGAEGKIWKVVDENGNVIYTDQAPHDGSKPMELPGLSIIASDIEVSKPSDRDA